ncbi:MAG: hypothetical protein JWQ32_598 [Marmoricola sp.]|nr:hypothetical protein [Marmoricola sp.]
MAHMSHNTSGVVVGYIVTLMAGLSFTLGLIDHSHRQIMFGGGLLAVTAFSTGYLMYRRRHPAIDQLLANDPDSSYWRRARAQAYLMVGVGVVLCVAIIGLALLRTFKNHQPVELILMPVALWCLGRFVSGLRKMRATTNADIKRKMVETRGSGTVVAPSGPASTWSTWSETSEAPLEE